MADFAGTMIFPCARMSAAKVLCFLMLSMAVPCAAQKFGNQGLPKGDPDYLYRTNIDALRAECKFEYGPLEDMFPSFIVNHFPDTDTYDKFDGADYTPHNHGKYPKHSGWGEGLHPHAHPEKLYGGLCDVAAYEDGNNWRLMRVGPFTSNGGYDWWQFAGHDALNMSDVRKGKKIGINAHYVVGVEASQDKSLGYPPLHVHHIHVVPEKPWLRYQWPSRRPTWKEYGTQMMTSQGGSHYAPNYLIEQHGEWDLCDIKDDPEAGCFAESLPEGYTNLIDFNLDLEGEVNDNRETNATDLIWWLEVGLGWTHDIATLKPASYLIQLEDHGLITEGHQYSYENYYWVPTKGQHISYYQATHVTDGTLLRAKSHNHMTAMSKTLLIDAPASALGLEFTPRDYKSGEPFDKMSPCLFDLKQCDRFKYTTTIPIEDTGFDNLDSFEYSLRERIAQLRSGNDSVICEMDTGLTPFGYNYVGEYSHWKWDRAGRTKCRPWTFSKGQQFTSITFHEFQMPFPGPWESSGIVPELTPMHNQWNLVYESSDAASNYILNIGDNMLVSAFVRAVLKETAVKQNWIVVYENASMRDKMALLLHSIRFWPPMAFVCIFVFMLAGSSATLLKRKAD